MIRLVMLLLVPTLVLANAPEQLPLQELLLSVSSINVRWQTIEDLDKTLSHALKYDTVGNYAGYKLSTCGTFVSFEMQGRDAKKILETIKPLLTENKSLRGSTITLIYGIRGTEPAPQMDEFKIRAQGIVRQRRH
jgi:hypothetical protein